MEASNENNNKLIKSKINNRCDQLGFPDSYLNAEQKWAYVCVYHKLKEGFLKNIYSVNCGFFIYSFFFWFKKKDFLLRIMNPVKSVFGSR